jgi:AbrB family looped-hinge helix DNA binding protein
MPKVSLKRQITLPANQCKALGIKAGDEVESFIADGHLTIIKKCRGAADGLLKQVKGNLGITDEASLQSTVD